MHSFALQRRIETTASQLHHLATGAALLNCVLPFWGAHYCELHGCELISDSWQSLRSQLPRNRTIQQHQHQHQHPANTSNMSAANETKTVLITGANRGIGLTFAEYYTKAGWQVIGTARDADKAQDLNALSPFKVVQMETRDEDSIQRVAKELEGVPIDLLINNAGILEEGDFQTTTKESLMRQFEVNSVAPFLVTRALFGNLKLASAASGSATVASISTMLSSISINNGGSYGDHKMTYGGRYGYRSSKTALNMINSCLAVDLRDDKIIAVVLQPGYVNTALTYGKGVVQPVDSVAGMTKVIAGLTLEDTAKFFDFKGPELPW